MAQDIRKPLTMENSHALVLLIDSLDNRLSSLEQKLDAVYKNGMSQLKADIEVMNYSIQSMSDSLKAHLDWHNEAGKKHRGLMTILTFLAGIVAGRLGEPVEALLVKLFSLL